MHETAGQATDAPAPRGQRVTRDGILVLTASAGAGHIVAARAIEQALHTAAPQTPVEVLDVLAISNPFFRRLYAGGYLGLVRYAPAAMGWLYDTMDRRRQGGYDAIRVLIQNLNRLPTTRVVRRRRPRLIIHTHFLPAEYIAGLRRAGELDCPQVTVTTDFETHRLWVQPPTERYYCATEEGKQYLTTWGVHPEQIVVSGIPVRSEFSSELTRDEARRRHRLAGDVPVVLLLCGGFGVGPTAEFLFELAHMPVNAQVVAVAGRNEKLRQQLERVAAHTSRHVRVLGYTDAMHELMRAADLAVTKPGGMTVSEALACGLPLVIVNPIPGQETRNSDFLLEAGAAIKVNNQRLLGHRVSTLLRDGARLAALRAAAQAHGRPDAAAAIVRDALRILR